MDFDDLDEAEAEAGAVDGPAPPVDASRAAANAGGAASQPPLAYQPWEYFPPIRRNFRLPDFDRLPPAIVRQVFGDQKPSASSRQRVCIRAFVFYGAGDAWYAWAELAAKAPEFCDVAVFEWPSHGDDGTSRGEEDACETLDALAEDALRAVRESLEQHAAGGRIAGAPFVLIGHSIGCLLVTALAQKLRAQVGLEPAAVIMLDRAPPHIPLHSELGRRYSEENPWDFMRDYNPPIHKAAQDSAKADPKKGERIIRRWIDDIRLANDTRPIGFHQFSCDLVVLRAMDNFKAAHLKEDASEEERAFHVARDPLMGSPPGCSADFSPEQFEEWAQWTEPGKFALHDITATHMSIKTHRDAWQIIWDVLEAKRAPDPPKRQAA